MFSCYLELCLYNVLIFVAEPKFVSVVVQCLKEQNSFLSHCYSVWVFSQAEVGRSHITVDIFN